MEVTSACIAVNEAVMSSSGRALIKELVGYTFIQDVPLSKLLMDSSGNRHVRITKSLMGLPVSSEILLNRFKFSPDVNLFWCHAKQV